MSNSRKRSPEFIDLLWDSSDDETLPSKKVAAKKTKKGQLSENKKSSSTAATEVLVAASTSPVSSSWQVATYNVWFGPKTGPLHSEERMMALSRSLLEKNKTDKPLRFVGFQEVTAELWATLKPAFESAGYKLICQDISGGGYGVALAILQEPGLKIIQYGWQPYQSTIMNRGFLYARAQLPNSSNQVLFTTTHLESFVPATGFGGQPYTGAAEREQQIGELERYINNHMNRYPDLALAMISGDLNWDDERVKSEGVDKTLTKVLTDKTWKDPWFVVRDRRRLSVADKKGKVKKKDEPTCYTYDSKESLMLGGHLRRRFDRILFRQNGLKVKVGDIELVGKDPIQGLTWNKESNWNGRVTQKVVPVLPSDHFGLVLSLSKNPN